MSPRIATLTATKTAKERTRDIGLPVTEEPWPRQGAERRGRPVRERPGAAGGGRRMGVRAQAMVLLGALAGSAGLSCCGARSAGEPAGGLPAFAIAEVVGGVGPATDLAF